MIESLEIQAQIEIMDESVLLVSNVDKSGIERGKDLFDFSKIDISHTVAPPFRLLLVQLDEPLVLQQSDGNVGRSYVNDQIFVHTCIKQK